MSLKSFLYILVGALILMIPAFYNGYPMVYSDTGTYIGSGMNLLLPKDRPIMYGLFIRITSLQLSLWPVIFVQSMLITYTLWHLLRLGVKSISRKVFIVILFLLSWFTGLGWYVSQIMPDIYTFTTIGALLLLIFERDLKLYQKGIFGFIFVLSVNVHFSNVLIGSLTLLGLVVAVKRKFIAIQEEKSLSFSIPALLILLSLAIASLTNFKVGGSFGVSQGSHVFLMGKMLDSGVLKSFLDDKCQGDNYILCGYKDNLPADNRDLLWGKEGPLRDHGGWEKAKGPYNKILLGIFTSPKHVLQYLYNCGTSTISQLFQNEIGSGIASEWYRQPNSPPYERIAKHFPFELNQYNQSRQNKNLWGQELNFTSINHVYHLLLLIAVLFLFLVVGSASLRSLLPDRTKLVVATLILGVLSNALVAASLANVYDRLQARIGWVFILASIIIFLTNRALFLERLKEWFRK